MTQIDGSHVFLKMQDDIHHYSRSTEGFRVPNTCVISLGHFCIIIHFFVQMTIKIYIYIHTASADICLYLPYIIGVVSIISDILNRTCYSIHRLDCSFSILRVYLLSIHAKVTVYHFQTTDDII